MTETESDEAACMRQALQTALDAQIGGRQIDSGIVLSACLGFFGMVLSTFFRQADLTGDQQREFLEWVIERLRALPYAKEDES